MKDLVQNLTKKSLDRAMAEIEQLRKLNTDLLAMLEKHRGHGWSLNHSVCLECGSLTTLGEACEPDCKLDALIKQAKQENLS